MVSLRRPRRRFIALLLLACSALALWNRHGFWVLPPRFLSRSRTTYTLNSGLLYVTGSYDWAKTRIYYPVADIRPPPARPPKVFPEIQARRIEKDESDKEKKAKERLADERKKTIKEKFIKSWAAYRKHAWGRDELVPLTTGGKRSLSGWGAQIIDALDTLWIMGLRDEFNDAVAFVATIDWSRTWDWDWDSAVNFHIFETINVFEVTIRYLGGLLAAHDLSGEPALLAKAIELGDLLYTAFDTPNRLPLHWLSLGKAARGTQRADSNMSGAAGGTLCLEFTRLSQMTGNPKYYDATERIKNFLYSAQSENRTRVPGLWPIMMNWRDEQVDGPYFSVGAGMDSLYEYLPKMHMLLGGLDDDYKEMTIRSLDAIHDFVLFRPMVPGEEDILMAGITIKNGQTAQIVPEMQHLACFAGGMYALVARLVQRDDYVEIASKLTRGCVWAYDAFPTGIMPEKVRMTTCPTKQGKCSYRHVDTDANEDVPEGFVRVVDSRYLLRPEAIESVFYMWRVTGDEAWRDAAWRMWEAIVRETETSTAFASVEDVRIKKGPMINSMETFWMGETLKYFYLIFEDPSVISLDDWVLNTEAHPFRRPKLDGNRWRET